MSSMWNRVTGWVSTNAEHVTVEFIDEPGGVPIDPQAGYLRIFLAEGFVSKAVTWGNKHFPVVHGGARLSFLGGTAQFTSVSEPDTRPDVPGAQLDVRLTPLLPFNGGVVEVEAALYQASAAGPLVTALKIVGGFDTLLVPPLSVAATIAGKVADGIDHVLGDEQPVLGVHYSMVSPGGGGHVLHPGWLAVVATPPAELRGRLSMQPSGLCLDNGSGPRQLAGTDYLVVRIECRTERDDWRFPELDELIRAAGQSYLSGYLEDFKDRRTEAVSRAWSSPDLTPADRIRVAKLVADEIDAVSTLHAVPGPDRSLEDIADERLPAPDAPELAGLTLSDLLA
jgi:hypothetical protein